MEAEIFRPMTEQEKKDMREVGSETPYERFAKELAKVEQKFTRAHLPFDRVCARLEFQDELERVTREAERTFGFVRPQDVERLKFPDLEVYGNPERFEQVEDDTDTEFMNVNGVRTPTVVGHTIKYKCRKRGHGISVFVPNDVYAERFGKKVVK